MGIGHRILLKVDFSPYLIISSLKRTANTPFVSCSKSNRFFCLFFFFFHPMVSVSKHGSFMATKGSGTSHLPLPLHTLSLGLTNLIFIKRIWPRGLNTEKAWGYQANSMSK